MSYSTNQFIVSRISYAIHRDEVASWLIVLLAFFIPISTTLVNICVLFILGTWLFGGNIKKKITWYLSYPLTKPILLLTFTFIIGITYTSADLEQVLSSMRDVFRICFIPILAYYLYEKPFPKKDFVLWAFCVAMLFTLLLSFLKVFNYLSIGEKHYGSGIFKSHIKTSYFMAMAIFFLFVQFYYKIKQFFLFSLISVMFYYMFYINTGRTGYLVLFAAFFIFTGYHFRLKGVAILIALFGCVLYISYLTSDIFASRVNELHHELALYMHGKTVSSLGTRLEFGVNSFSLFLERLVWGFGTGSFLKVYAKFYEGKATLLTDNPHNEYLSIMVQLGIMGLVALSWFFLRVWQEVIKIENLPDKIFALGFVFAFVLGCFLNSCLSDFAESHYFCLMVASLLPVTQKNNSL